MDIFDILENIIKCKNDNDKLLLLRDGYFNNVEMKKVLDFLLKTENFVVLRNFTFDKINRTKFSNNIKHISETIDEFIELLEITIKTNNRKKKEFIKKYISLYYISDKKTRHIFNRLIKNSFFIDISVNKKDIIEMLSIKTPILNENSIYKKIECTFDVKIPGSYIYFFIPSSITVMYDRQNNILYTKEYSRINKLYELENQCKLICDEFGLESLIGCLYTDLSTNIKSIRKHMLYRLNGKIHKSFVYYIIGVNYNTDKYDISKLNDNFNKFIEINKIIKEDRYKYNKIIPIDYYIDKNLIYSDVTEHASNFYENTGFVDFPTPYICYKSPNKFIIKPICIISECVIKKANIECFADGTEYIESFDVQFNPKTIATCSLITLSTIKRHNMLLNLDKYINKTIKVLIYNKKYNKELNMYYYDYCLYYDLF